MSFRDVVLMFGPLIFIVCLYGIFRGFRGLDLKLPEYHIYTPPPMFSETKTETKMYKKIIYKDGTTKIVDLTEEEKASLMKEMNETFEEMNDSFKETFKR